MTHATLKVYGGNVQLKTDGKPLAVEIEYKGSFEGYSNLPNGFILVGGKGKIIVLRMNSQDFPENIFSYLGTFYPKKVVLYEKEWRLTGNIERPRYEWKYTTGKWEDQSSEWQSFFENNEEQTAQMPPFAREFKRHREKGSSIVTNNINSSSGRLATKDGESYYGPVHYYSSGYFMTGASYSEDSVRLYEKDKLRINNRRRNG